MKRSAGDLLSSRFWAKVRKTDGCWEWTGAKTRNGYGRFKSGGVMRMAHRVAYELEVGPIPEGLTLDHGCRNRGCVRPTHLEPVTPRENVLRAESVTARNAKKIACDMGHPLSGANLFVRRDGRRLCRACKRAGERRRRKTAEYRSVHAAEERARRARIREAT